MAPRDLPGTRRALDTASSTRAPTTSHAPPPAPVSDLFVDPMMGCPLAMYVDKDVPDQAEIQRLIVVRAPPCLRGACFSLTARRNTAGTCPSGTVRCHIYSVSKGVMRAGAMLIHGLQSIRGRRAGNGSGGSGRTRRTRRSFSMRAGCVNASKPVNCRPGGRSGRAARSRGTNGTKMAGTHPARCSTCSLAHAAQRPTRSGSPGHGSASRTYPARAVGTRGCRRYGILHARADR